jgi:hypothetical protein
MEDYNYTPHEKECASIIDQLCPVFTEATGTHVGPDLFKCLTLRLAELTALYPRIGKPDQSGYPANLQTKERPKTEREIYMESAVQDAGTKQWKGWNWRSYQRAIVRLNHRVSQLEARAVIAAELLSALTTLLKMVEDGDWTTVELDEARAVIAKAEQKEAT